MEDLDQAYGYILYRIAIPRDARRVLAIDGLHDYAQIYANGTLLGTLDHRLKQDHLAVKLKKGTRLDILVENSGRVNFTTAMRGERKGIVGSVHLDGIPLHGWTIYSLPMTSPEQMHYKTLRIGGPSFYRGSFQSNSNADTFLDTSAFTKGFVWVNGHPLGRIWEVGPQNALFLPGAWLKKDRNEVIVFDFNGVDAPELRGLDHPALNGPLVSDGPISKAAVCNEKMWPSFRRIFCSSTLHLKSLLR